MRDWPHVLPLLLPLLPLCVPSPFSPEQAGGWQKGIQSWRAGNVSLLGVLLHLQHGDTEGRQWPCPVPAPPAAASQPCVRAGHIQPARAAGTRAGSASCPSAGQDPAPAIPWEPPMWGWGSQEPGPVLPAHGSFSLISHVQGPDMSSQETPQARRFPIEAGDCPSLAAAPEAQEPVGAEQPAGR